MAGAKRPTERRKKRSSSSSRAPTAAPSRRLKTVRASAAPGAEVAARRFGVSASTLRRWARAGRVRAIVDAEGHYHFPGAAPARGSPSRPLKKKRIERFAKKTRTRTKKVLPRKKVRVAPIAAPPPKPVTRSKVGKKVPFRKKRSHSAKKSAPARKVVVRKKKVVRRTPARPVKKPLPKKTPALGKGKRPRAPTVAPQPSKKKRPGKKLVRRKKVVRAPTRGPTEPSIFGPDVPARGGVPPPPTVVAPMAVEAAAQIVGGAMSDYIHARYAWERELTHEQFYGLKHAFRHTYGVRKWQQVFEWIMDEWDLDQFTFDREALRDS